MTFRNWGQITLTVERFTSVHSQQAAGYHVITPALEVAYSFYHWNHSFELGYGRQYPDIFIRRIYRWGWNQSEVTKCQMAWVLYIKKEERNSCYIDQGWLADFFCKRQESRYFRLYRPWDTVSDTTAHPAHHTVVHKQPQFVNKQVSQQNFIKKQETSCKLDLVHRL